MVPSLIHNYKYKYPRLMREW